MRARPIFVPAILLLVSLLLAAVPAQPAKAQVKVTGGVLLHSVLPKKVCVGDTITLSGAASVTGEATPPLAWLPTTLVDIKAELGQVTPTQIHQFNDGFYFNFTYKATQPGTETITLTVNQHVASTTERFVVEEKCDYDAFVTTVMHFSADMGDEIFQSITHVTGTGTMKRDREGSEFYQGDGTWHLEEIILSKPSICVEYYTPPLILHGPFELDGHLTDEGDTVDVILGFLPNQTQGFYHGQTVCVDENGDVGYGEGWGRGGDPSLASKIETSFLSGGGTQTVELTGAGMDMVRSVGDLDYTATLTLIPR
ncbi:MAG TPA: hypothetical protein VFF68_11340 [Anaerolineaceae bacterium]|nr:hypothetical protein [Anaerolineaceae bacterium]